jgi:hypothetical protein
MVEFEEDYILFLFLGGHLLDMTINVGGTRE